MESRPRKRRRNSDLEHNIEFAARQTSPSEVSLSDDSDTTLSAAIRKARAARKARTRSATTSASTEPTQVTSEAELEAEEPVPDKKKRRTSTDPKVARPQIRSQPAKRRNKTKIRTRGTLTPAASSSNIEFESNHQLMNARARNVPKRSACEHPFPGRSISELPSLKRLKKWQQKVRAAESNRSTRDMQAEGRHGLGPLEQ